MRTLLWMSGWTWLFVLATSLAAGQPNRLTYLDEFCDPYYVSRDFPKLTTPQWVGDEEVEAVVVLAIDDMLDPAKYETYLRPILQRLKEIDGRAPVSIMTCQVDTQDPQLQEWLHEGVSIECHTADHPCPLLQGGDFAKARSTYDRCIDLLGAIPGSQPVAFRMPCCDSRNTPSPRFWTEIFNKQTEQNNFLQMDSSVFNITSVADSELPRSLTTDGGDRERFRKYLPFPSFVNTIEDYPYPYVIGRLCWEFPCVVPSDWEAQNIQEPNNPKTVEDMKAGLDAAVIKQGTFNLVFHPHGWIRNDQIVELIDHAVEKHGRKVKFLTFREALERINQNLLLGNPLRDSTGNDNEVRLMDLDNDGYLDVVLGGDDARTTRRWLPEKKEWVDSELPCALGIRDEPGRSGRQQVRFGTLGPDGHAMMLTAAGVWRYSEKWEKVDELTSGLGSVIAQVRKQTPQFGDLGIRCRDLDGDGTSEILVSNEQMNQIRRWDQEQEVWRELPFALPEHTSIVDQDGRDAGLRFVDVNRDGLDDVLFSDGERYSLHLFKNIDEGWAIEVLSGRRGDPLAPEPRIPMIVRPDGTNNGAWFHSRTMWVQNENTDQLPDGVDRLPFDQMLGSN